MPTAAAGASGEPFTFNVAATGLPHACQAGHCYGGRDRREPPPAATAAIHSCDHGRHGDTLCPAHRHWVYSIPANPSTFVERRQASVMIMSVCRCSVAPEHASYLFALAAVSNAKSRGGCGRRSPCPQRTLWSRKSSRRADASPAGGGFELRFMAMSTGLAPISLSSD